MKNRSEIEYSAAALFDGGWRADDREELIREYELSEEEADELCEELKEMEPKTWFAILEDDEDCDWGTGSESWDEAVVMLKKQGHGLIATIRDGKDPVCEKLDRYEDVIEEEPMKTYTIVITENGTSEISRSNMNYAFDIRRWLEAKAIDGQEDAMYMKTGEFIKLEAIAEDGETAVTYIVRGEKEKGFGVSAEEALERFGVHVR